MNQPALSGMGQPVPDTPLEALRLYASLKLRCMPALYGDKLPHKNVGNWGTLVDALPLADRLIDQIAGWGPINVAIICDGAVTVVDIDNLDFVNWLEARGPERIGTWITSTPRGGRHVYLRSDDLTTPTIIKAASGEKIADLKGRGGYVIAPPSVGKNGEYATEYGSPDQILRVRNALEWITALVAERDGTMPVRIDRVVADNAGGRYDDTRAQGEPPESEKVRLLAKLEAAWHARDLMPAIYHTIVSGVDAAPANYWKAPGDHSGVDFGCVKELIKLGWQLPEIEMVWAFCPVGVPRYLGNDKSRGHGYLERTFDNASKRAEAERIDLENVVGGNFRLIATPPPERWDENGVRHYRYTLERIDGPTPTRYTLEHDGRAFGTPQRFSDACYAQGLFADLGNLSDKKSLRVLGALCDSLAVERDIPEIATREGQIRHHIRMFVLTNFGVNRGPDAKAWLDAGWVHVNTRWLMYALMLIRPVPAPPDVWKQWERMRGVRADASGAVWKAPISSFPELS